MTKRPTAPKRRNVALIVETSLSYGRQILHGIAQYLKSHRRWSVFLDERELDAPPPDWISEWRGDGVIIRSTTPEWARVFRRRRMNVVDLSDRCPSLSLPRVSSDMHQIGRLAAEHLIERGFPRLAYCGFTGELWSLQRRDGFAAAAGDRFCPEFLYESPWVQLRSRPWQEARDQIARWLQSLPRPIGIMACNDARGQHVLDACAQLKLAVPDEVAVIGVDDTATFCELCEPPLSSVAPNAERVGFEAAALLDAMMDGRTTRAQSKPLLIPPRGIVTRQSTNVFAVSDPLVSQAVRFIREHIRERLSVTSVTERVHCSRATLERRFREHLGHSPQVEIRQTLLREIKHLLVETDWTLPRIAQAVGMEHPEYIAVLFRRELGVTPNSYRQRHRSGGA